MVTLPSWLANKSTHGKFYDSLAVLDGTNNGTNRRMNTQESEGLLSSPGKRKRVAFPPERHSSAAKSRIDCVHASAASLSHSSARNIFLPTSLVTVLPQVRIQVQRWRANFQSTNPVFLPGCGRGCGPILLAQKVVKGDHVIKKVHDLEWSYKPHAIQNICSDRVRSCPSTRPRRHCSWPQSKDSNDYTQADNPIKAVLFILKVVAIDPPIAKFHSSYYFFQSFDVMMSL